MHFLLSQILGNGDEKTLLNRKAILAKVNPESRHLAARKFGAVTVARRPKLTTFRR